MLSGAETRGDHVLHEEAVREPAGGFGGMQVPAVGTVQVGTDHCFNTVVVAGV